MILMKKVISLQLNELNFNYIKKYVEDGHLPEFKKLFDTHGFVPTKSEDAHELANPWIQWPTVHSGLDYAEHGVFRLGDILKTNHELIYEVLERNGLTVAAMCPFNAANNTQRPAFFVPDPWTLTPFAGPNSLKFLYDGVRQASDDYANSRISPRSMVQLVLGALANFQVTSVPHYLRQMLNYYGQNKKWYRALICDRLLGDAFITQWKRYQPDFSTLFLNGGAHLQHHYLFSSKYYSGPRTNPEWHVPQGEDPLLDILRVYDTLIGELAQLAEKHDIRLMIMTALSQAPHERVTYYYRLKNQVAFLDRIGIDYVSTYRLMTEDFVIKFQDEVSAMRAHRILESVCSFDCEPIFYKETGDSPIRTQATVPNIFHIENRGSDLYLQLRPVNQAVPKSMKVRSGDVIIQEFDALVDFAQFKNTHHVGDGYLSDNTFDQHNLPPEIPLKNVFDIILNHFGITRPVARETVGSPLYEDVRA